ncbi:MAG: hypothetical protein PHR61_03655 [Candidatus Absconditabacteria bacterium]|nr:hypothetical protein [Candidatus Absconditabacteria bacterium]
MINTINISEKDGIDKKMRSEIIDILIKNADLDRNFRFKNFSELNSNELEYLFAFFEKHYKKIKNHFKNGNYLFPDNFNEFKKIQLGNCKNTYSEYKDVLLKELSKNKKKLFFENISKNKNIDIKKIGYFLIEIGNTSQDYILGRINNQKEFAENIQKTGMSEIKKLIYIINNMNDNKKVITLLETLGKDLGKVLSKYEEDVIIYLCKKMETKDIIKFFDIKTFGFNQLETTLHCKYIEKIFEIIENIGSESFLLSIQNAKPEYLAKLIDGTTIKGASDVLLKNDRIKEIESNKTIEEIILETNHNIFKKEKTNNKIKTNKNNMIGEK